MELYYSLLGTRQRLLNITPGALIEAMSNEDRRTIENLAMIQQLITEGRVDLALDEIRFQLDLLKASGLLADSAYEEAIKKGRDEAIALITIPEGISEGELSVEQEA